MNKTCLKKVPRTGHELVIDPKRCVETLFLASKISSRIPNCFPWEFLTPPGNSVNNSSLLIFWLSDQWCKKQLKMRLQGNKRISLEIFIVSPEPHLQLFCVHGRSTRISKVSYHDYRINHLSGIQVHESWEDSLG